MIRFVKNILDIKNILGMQRTPQPIPIPVYPANEVILQGIGGTFSFNALWTGSLHVRSVVGGSGITGVYQDSIFAGQDLQGSADDGTDVRMFNAPISSIKIPYNDVSFIALSDTVTDLSLATDPNIETIDLRNAAVLTTYAIGATNTSTLYARADTTSLRDVCVAIINNSTVADGTLWIDQTQTYAPDVITAAIAKGWTVYNL